MSGNLILLKENGARTGIWVPKYIVQELHNLPINLCTYPNNLYNVRLCNMKQILIRRHQ